MQDTPKPLTAQDIETMEELPTTAQLAPSQVLSIRLNSDELRTLSHEAHLVGLKVGTFIKRAALDAALVHRFSGPPPVTFGFGMGGEGYSGFQAPRPLAGSAGAATVIYNGAGNSYQLNRVEIHRVP